MDKENKMKQTYVSAGVTPAPANGSLLELMRESYELRKKIRADEERIKIINRQLVSAADFEDGTNTARLSAGNLTAKIQRRYNVAWDQGKLWGLRDELDENVFWSVFKAELKPVIRMISALAPHQKDAVLAAKTEKEGAPNVEITEDAGAPNPGV
jgi:hypothetical protein